MKIGQAGRQPGSFVPTSVGTQDDNNHKVKTVWEWSAETEAKRLIHTAHNIAVGFFRVNNFFVAPWKPIGGSCRALSPSDVLAFGCGRSTGTPSRATRHLFTMAVPFPELPYQTIPRFWDRVKRANIKNFPLEFEPELVEAVKKLVETMGLAEPEMKEIKENWGKASKDVLDSIRSLLPEAEIGKILDNTRLPRPTSPELRGARNDESTKVSEIIIHPTNFGTTCSFSIVDKFPAAVEMYLRQDQDIYAITEAILSAVTRNEVYRDLNGMWSESELLVDWLLMKSSLSPILKKYQPKTSFIPTVKYIRMKQNARLMKESEEFYRRLGAPVLENIFAVKDGQPMISGKPMENVSPREREILAAMIKKSNSVVTIDELADLLFKNYEEFSLAAIAKTIQRLRDKLEQNGVSGSFIQTLRGQGYVLKN